MTYSKPDIDAIAKAVADTPRRDNTAYHEAMAQARRAFEEAQAAFGEQSVQLKMKTKIKRNGDHVVKWTFKRAT
jgi:hypothetical protein